MIVTENGKTIIIYHDVSTMRPYSRIHLVTGTEAHSVKYPEEQIAKGENWLKADELNALKEKYTPEIVKRVGEIAKNIGGHGGMDFIMQWRLIDCLRNGLPLEQDVYDAASWSCITPLSEWSVNNRSNSVDVPDFTRGAWKTNEPIDISLSKGGNTGVKL